MCRALDSTSAADSQRMRDTLMSEQRNVQDLTNRIATLERALADEKQQAATAVRAASTAKDSAVEAVNAQVWRVCCGECVVASVCVVVGVLCRVFCSIAPCSSGRH